jgi:hypothetical protein
MSFAKLGIETLALLMVGQGTALAASFGRWHVPSTPAQFFGYGYGPGHHAPMVRRHGVQPPVVPRVVWQQGSRGVIGYPSY